MSDATAATRIISKHEREVRVVRPCAVRVVAGPSRRVTAEIGGGVFRIGSHESNDLVVADDTVSKHHLEITVIPDGWRIVDLGSSNGTFLGDVRVGEIVVNDATELTLGGSRLELAPRGDEVEVPASSHTEFGRLLGRSTKMRELFAQLEAVAASDCSVIIEGETGVGKDAVARSLHERSPRAAGPFVVVDCGALVGDLFEAELFGAVRGAFTGADRDRVGLLQAADGGSVLLDEIDSLPLHLQAKLLSPLERREVTPVGGTRAVPIDVRVLAATQQDLARMVNQRRFRPDLFYRLSVVRVRVPPLRERAEDLPLLVSAFLEELRAQHGGDVAPELSALAMARLRGQPWPGNVRELRNTVERVVLKLRGDGDPASRAIESYVEARDAAREAFDERYFTALLAEPGISLSEAARRSGLDRRYLQRILRRLGIALPRS